MNTRNEPVRLVNHLLTMVRLGLAFMVGLGVFNLTTEQLEQAVLFAGSFFAVIEVMSSEWVRGQVVPVKKFRPRVQKAINEKRIDDVRAPAVPAPSKPPVDLPDHGVP